MFVIICYNCSFIWIVRNYVEMWQLYVDLCGDDWWCIYVTTICWLNCGCCWWLYICQVVVNCCRCIYTNWMVMNMFMLCCLLNMLNVGGEFIHANFNGDIVGECMYAKWWWWRGELFMWTYALSRVICSCIHDWWWWILYPRLMVADFISNWGDYDVFVASKVTTLRWSGTACI